ncbi:MAG: sugar lactone lactonase YvrE [Dokdonia sp.]|jgi:sugar lactone lactonase YvrE
MFKYVLLFLFGNCLFAQNVTTYFDAPSVDVDDSMVFDADGNLYGSNFIGTTVYKITPDGVATPFITGLENPNGLAFDDDGNLFLSEFSASRINKYDSNGNLLESFTINGLPSGLTRAFEGDAMIFTNVSNNSVNRLDADGTITEIYQGAPLNAPVGLTYDEDGVLYVGNFTGREIYKLVGDDAIFIATIPDGGATGGNDALGFIVYVDGRIYGTNFGGHQIYSVNPDGEDDFFVFAGSDQGNQDGSLSEATFNTPNGIIYNETEDALFISEFSGEGNIRRIDDITLGIQDFSSDFQVIASPNPVTDIVHITTNKNLDMSNTDIRLYDNLGRSLLKSVNVQAKDSNTVTVDMSSYIPGVYFLKIMDSRGQMDVIKLLKER